MNLTSGQKSQLKTYITSNSDTNAAYLVGNNQLLANLLNQDNSPNFWVFRTSQTRDNYIGQTSQDGTTFIFAGDGFVSRTASEILAFNSMFSSEGKVNPSMPNVVQGFIDIFTGAVGTNAQKNRTHLAAMSRRLASRCEKVFQTGAGTTANPDVLVTEGPITVSDLSDVKTW